MLQHYLSIVQVESCERGLGCGVRVDTKDERLLTSWK